jgi:glycosyltransferase involved in cell wall biosynthesis
MPAVAAALRRWDRKTAAGVHHFVAISRFIADRIRRAYGRESDVIYPPVDVSRFRIDESPPGDFYLVVSALTPYKRVDLAVEAATRLRRRLLVVGTGPEERRLRALAGPTVELLGWRDDSTVAELYAGCRALIFPTREDFGITPLEAMAAGRPVIAFGRGGALETVVPPGGAEPPTGLFFADQTVDALVDGIRRFESGQYRFEPKTLRLRAAAFDRALFKERIHAYLTAKLAEHGGC